MDKTPTLANALSKDRIRLEASAPDWENAVRASGEILLSLGDVTQGYIEAMVCAVKEIGPYMVLIPGVALAHARPEDGVNRICMSLVRLDEPVEFGSEANDPVDLVFGLGAVDNISHTELLREFALLLQDADAIQAIREAESVDAVYAAILTRRSAE